MAITIVRNSTSLIGVVATDVVGYRITSGGSGLIMTVLLSGCWPEIQFETAANEAAMTPLVTAFINAVEA